MNVGRGELRCIVLICVASFTCAIAPERACAVDFLVPGISLESVSLAAGARVSYLVTSEVFGVIDSSYVELRVLEHTGGTYRLEITSSPYRRSREGSTAVRLRLAERVTAAASPEAFRACLREVLVREGAGDFRAATKRELDELDIEGLFIPPNGITERRALDPEKIMTPAGAFLCDGVELLRKQSRVMNLGGVRAERNEEETSRTWRSREVPLWGLVKSTVEKKSITTSSSARAHQERPRVTKTESILLSYKKPRSRS